MEVSVFDEAVVRSWWLVALRGVAAVVFGVLTLLNPGIGLATLVLLFGAFAMADGLLKVWTVIAHRREEPHWVGTLVGGLLGIAAGLIAFYWPGITAISLLFVIAAWAIVSGITEIATAVRLRKLIHGEWVLGAVGALSIALGILLAAYPAAGALALTVWIGAYAVVMGVMLVAVGVRLLAWGREHHVLEPRPA